MRRSRAIAGTVFGVGLLASGWWLLRERATEPEMDLLASILARVCPCEGEAEDIKEVGLIGSVALVDEQLQPIQLLDFGAPIPQDEMPLAALHRAIDDGFAVGQKLSLVSATRRSDLGLELLWFGIEGDLHTAKLYVVDEASRVICCKGDLSTYGRVVESDLLRRLR